MLHNRGAAETAVASTLVASEGGAADAKLWFGRNLPFSHEAAAFEQFYGCAVSRIKVDEEMQRRKVGGCGFRPRGSFTFSKDRCRYLECHRSLQPLQTSSSPPSHCHSGFRSSCPSWHASNQPDAAEAICNAVVNSRVWPSTVARVWVIISVRVRGLSRQV